MGKIKMREGPPRDTADSRTGINMWLAVENITSETF
jgi:hypothetical protein